MMNYFKTIILSLLASFMGATAAMGENFAETINKASTAQRDHRVIYEMNVGSFTQAGTFAAAADQLTELKSLGIDVVWLMPIYPRGGGINSPYAATNFQKTNSAYGTVADLKAFVSKAHELNMLVWLDWVPNHTATNAEWVSSHPEYYTRKNNQMVHPNNYGDVYELDYSNAGLRQAMNDCLKFWIDEADVDGYRCDYVSSPTIPQSYWTETIPMIKGYKTGKTIDFMAECNLPRDRKDLWEVGFDYDYAWAFQTGLDKYGTSTGIDKLKTVGNTLLGESSDKQFVRMLYVTNHDQNWNEEKKTLTQKYGDNRYLLSVFANTFYGMPLIYNGQEVGGNQALNYFQDTKINWSDKDNKMYNTLQTLCALKHDVEAMNDMQAPEFLGTGNDQVLAYTRTVGKSQVLVLINTATTAQQVTLSGLTAGNWTCWLNSASIADRVEQTPATFAASQSFSLEAKGYQIFVTNDASEPQLTGFVPTLESLSEITIFFESPHADVYSAWVWGDLGGGEAYCTNTSWPGDEMTLIGQTAEGNNVYKYTVTRVSQAPSYLIISKNGGNTKLYDGVAFVNHGYYVEGQNNPVKIITATGIRSLTSDPSPTGKGSNYIYDLSGRCVANCPLGSAASLCEEFSILNSQLKKGIYIRNGRKFYVQ